MDIILEIIVGRFITRFLGQNVRYFILKIFNRNIKYEDLSNSKQIYTEGLSQDFYNFIIGLLIFIPISILIAYIFYILKLL